MEPRTSFSEFLDHLAECGCVCLSGRQFRFDDSQSFFATDAALRCRIVRADFLQQVHSDEKRFDDYFPIGQVPPPAELED